MSNEKSNYKCNDPSEREGERVSLIEERSENGT